MSADIKQLREQMDGINAELVDLYRKRMEISEQIALYKKENNLPIYDPARERELLASVSELAGDKDEAGVRVMFSSLMELSRSRQSRIVLPESDTVKQIEQALRDTDQLFPARATVACQGREGAYSQAACEKLFTSPAILYFNTFEAVFSAVEKGLCRYGVIPVENSTAGSVNGVSDLMAGHDLCIVRSVRLHVNHSLLGKRGTKIGEIKEIVSHEQAIRQCSAYLATLKNVKITVCENTAEAAKLVAESERTDLAAIASSSCAELYGLIHLSDNVQDNQSNYTRFVCISKKKEIYPGADRTTLIMTAPHKPGALYRIMSRFYAHGINITRLESRPIPGRDFEFRFYFDVNESVYSPALRDLITELEYDLPEFIYLGSYSEIL